jgi:cyclohexanecarboxylate-CoA ligase
MPVTTVADRWSTEEIETFYATGQWTTDRLQDIIDEQVRRHGGKVFLTDDDRQLTYTELDDAARRFATALRGRGIGRGDRVAVQLPNWVEFGVVTAALSRIGAVLVPIMPIYRSDDVGYILANSEAVAAVTCGTYRRHDHAAMFVDLKGEVSTLRDVIVVRNEESSAETHSFEELIAGSAPAGDDDRALGASPDDPFVIVYSSGTTSRPKGCVHTFNTVSCGARMLGKAFGYSESDVQFGPSPITHMTGLVTSYLVPLVHGASSHLMGQWTPGDGVAHIMKHRCTVTVCATTFLQTLLDAYDPAVHDLSSMRLWTCAGSPIPPAIIERAEAALPGLLVLSLYGRSENVTTTTCTTTTPKVKALTSDGVALPFQEVRIVEELGREVARGQEGDIAYRGAMHMLEYLGNEAETAALFTPDGFSMSGDLGVMDDDGFVRVTGRSKDIVIRGGMNISVRQIEDLLTQWDRVRACAAVAMPDEVLGERVCLYLVPTEGAEGTTLEDVKDYLLGKGLTIRKVPERLEIVDLLPMTATGKIQKHVLRARIADVVRQESTA